MRRLWAGLWLAILALGAAGCADVAPRRLPEPFSSPLLGPETAQHRVYLPLVMPIVVKLGMAGCPASCAEFGCTWCYSWSLNPGREAGRESVPMLWDERDVFAQAGGNSDWLMGWNEPDICPSQACISPTEGAILWRLVELRNPGRKLLSPAPSHLRPEWLVEWREAYRSIWGAWPRTDGLAAHCYLQSADACIELVKRFEGWAREWAPARGQALEIWVTEFAFLPAYCNAQAEAHRFVRYLEAEPLITRYAPYVSYGGDPTDPSQCPSPYWSDCRPEADPSLLESDLKTLTPLGRVYAQPPDQFPWWGRGW